MDESLSAIGIRVVRAGARLDHEPGYRIDRPHGTGDWLFVQFLSPMLYQDHNGECALPVGTCVLYSPGRPQRYRPLPGRGYRNHWCHFDGVTAAALVARCRLDTDVPLACGTEQPIGRLVGAIAQELHQRQRHWAEAATAHLIHLLVACARGSHHEPHALVDTARRRQAHHLRALRAGIHQRLAERWTIRRMAALAGWSPSRFAHRYREVFGTSPMDDLLQSRISQAADLLSRPGMLVKTAAIAVGFHDRRHFAKTFRARMGCPPGTWFRRQVDDLP